MTVLIGMSGLLMGGLTGWYLHRHISDSSDTQALQQQLRHIREIDQRVSSAMATLHAYEKRLLAGSQLSENGSASTTSFPAGVEGGPDIEQSRSPSHLREPLDGQSLLDIKREADEHIWECSSALTRGTAVLDEDTLRRAQLLVDALVDTRETLEAQETDPEASPDAVQSCVTALHRARARFLAVARPRLGLDSLSMETEDQIEALAEQVFSPSHLPRPYMAAGVRLPEHRR